MSEEPLLAVAVFVCVVDKEETESLVKGL